MDRRAFLRSAAAGTGLALLGSASWTRPADAQPIFGALLAPDANGIQLPEGFTSRIIATTGELVGDTGFRWHPNPDGGATFAQPDGGWIYVSNDEASDGAGGVSMVRFDADANIIDAKSILQGTSRNCAGGATPWGTWLSCEEFGEGRVWECDPTGEREAVVRPLMGTFPHEAAAADETRGTIYLTEDNKIGALYRFTPTVWGDLSAGVLEVMTEENGELGWGEVPDPTADKKNTRNQVENRKTFVGGEGAWFEEPFLYFTTKGDNRVWRYNAATNELEIIYDIATAERPILKGVDNVTVSSAGDLYVCEDGGNMEVVVLSPSGAMQPFLRMRDGFQGSEVTGAAFDPSGTRMYVSSQRNPGTTFEISGPFGSVTDDPASRSTYTIAHRTAGRRTYKVRVEFRQPTATGVRARTCADVAPQ